MASVVSAILSFVVNNVLEIDEVYHEKLPDGRLKVVFVTSGVIPDVAKIKTLIWSIVGLPVQKVDECTVEELQAGTLLRRYKITVVLSPFIKGVTRDKSLGLKEVAAGKVIK